jgi:hypothetical protein
MCQVGRAANFVVEVILARTLSIIGEQDKKLNDSVLLEIDASPTDQELWKILLDRVKHLLGIREIAILAGVAARDPTFKMNDHDYRLPSDVND